MKFSEMPYARPDLDAVKQQFADLLARFKAAATYAEAHAVFLEEEKLNKHVDTLAQLASVRNTIDTRDKFYDEEMNFWNEATPQLQECQNAWSRAMLDSPFRADFTAEYGDLMFVNAEIADKAFSPDILDEMAQENKLTTEYGKLIASAQIPFEGGVYTLSQLSPFKNDPDDARRLAAWKAEGAWYKEHGAEFDGLYDQLVHLRDTMGKKLGYEGYTTLGYYRMGRLCYGPEEVKQFRENVRRDVVPVVARLRKEIGKKLGVDTLMLYDYDLIFPQGDPAPKGGKEAIFAAAKRMYHDMSRETGEFIDFMLATEAFDVDARKNKWGGGYCTSFMAYHQPFILANFNGTAGDVDVVTHEAGHAFADYTTANNRYVVELGVGGMETAETHSMSMEFFAWPYMAQFFGEDAGRYEFMHLLDALSFLPYGTIVDDFQRQVYENPDWTPAERKAAWRQLEAEFRPHITFDGIPYLEEGTRWQYQMHIYETPFYYIDYCLAQTAALQFLLASRKDYDDAFHRYVRFLSQGGEKVFTELLQEAGLRSPFQEGALQTVAQESEALLNELERALSQETK